MAPGRPAAHKSPTKFLNSKHRTIWHVSGSNKYVAKTEKGALVYNPKARYVKSPGGSHRLLTNTKANAPSPIRPKMVRSMRANAGTKRGARVGVHAGNLARLFSSPKRRGRPPKAPKSPNFLPNPHLRRVRKNKGMKRGPRMGLSLQKLFKM